LSVFNQPHHQWIEPKILDWTRFRLFGPSSEIKYNKKNSKAGSTDMKLGDLLSTFPEKEVIGNLDTEIQGLAYHSQKVEEGFLFAVIRGLREDGKRFVDEALKKGARALLATEPLPVSAEIVQVIVPDVREALARLSAVFYGNPSALLTLIGITGTNGKTTTSYLIERILSAAGFRVGVMGTINYRFPGQIMPAPTTTPESLDLQKNLRAMENAGVTHVILEASSHALDLQRVRHCDFDVAVFTNFTRDHLDYHGSMENYFMAKKLLFTQCLGESKKGKRFAVVNLDDPQGEELARQACGTLLGYGVTRHGEVWPERWSESPEGLSARVHTSRGSFDLASPLIGLHNLYNILAAVSAGEALGIPVETIRAGVAGLHRVPGRLERVPGKGPRVFVDYAHTPDALERALATLKNLRPARLIVVFGCGGDRDRGKRALMGQAAALGSDLVVITSDNPRREDPEGIIEEIEEGLKGSGRKRHQGPAGKMEMTDPEYLVIPDRREAIRRAIGGARDEDIILIAGKGHENYQVLGDQKIHFDDREEAFAALNARK
jgi:UDP-N-acetylmuramoyl-L-alanyl-D-glutamate--2,6-diaminopimelate ligase